MYSCTFLLVVQTLLPRSSAICSLCLSVNVVILVLLAVAFLIIVERNLFNLRNLLYKESPGTFTNLWCIAVKWDLESRFANRVFFHPDGDVVLPFESELSPDLRLQMARKGKEIPVLITAAEERLGAVIAAMNSVYHNSKANVVFTILTLNDTVEHLK